MALKYLQRSVGFLTGGRKQSFRDLPQEEPFVQQEEAFARATVAISRARSLYLIMGPLDMKGLLGAATVPGSLMYGANKCGRALPTFICMTAQLQVPPLDAPVYQVWPVWIESFRRSMEMMCQI